VSIQHIYKTIAVELLEAGGEIVPDHVLRLVQVRYPDEWAAESYRLQVAAGKKEIQKVLKSLQIDDDDMSHGSKQLTLPGVELPGCLTLPTEGGYSYKAVKFCTWEDWERHRSVLEDNIRAAVHERDVQVEAAERFRQIMQGTDKTFGDALDEL
jgi:hypothetical protein